MRRIIILAIVTLTLLGTVAFARAATAPPPPAATDCTLIVPTFPQRAASLATPYQLTGPGCSESDPATSAFVQATIISPTGQMSVYSPLVVNAGQSPAAAPVAPVIPDGSTVGIFFGFDGVNLTLQGHGLESCHTGLGQFAYCNAHSLYHAMDLARQAGTLTVPPLGVSTLGDACPSVASFDIVDQDPSDNVQTKYLTGNGYFAQDTAANRALFPQATVLGNPSDNGLLTGLVDPAIGCTPWTAPDLADPGANVASYALDEYQASALQQAPFAAVPSVDEMTLVNGQPNGHKVEDYRDGANQPMFLNGSESYYCANLAHIAPAWLTLHRAGLSAVPSPVPADSNLFTFLADRFTATYEMVLPTPGTVPTCDTVTGIPDPVTLITQVTGATITVVP